MTSALHYVGWEQQKIKKIGVVMPDNEPLVSNGESAVPRKGQLEEDDLFDMLLRDYMNRTGDRFDINKN